MGELDDLARDLANDRPVPGAQLLDRLCQHVESTPVRRVRSSWHARLGLVAAAGVLAAFSALGGVSALASAARAGAHRVSTVVSTPAPALVHHARVVRHDSDDVKVCERDDHRVHHVTHRQARYLKAAHLADDAPCPVP